MATGTTYSDREFLFRLQTLVIDGGTEVVRNLFDQHLQNQSLNVFLANEQRKLNNLRRQKIITQAQYELMYPSSGLTPTSDEFDITLIVCLLRNLPALGLNQNYTWNIPPQPSDKTVEADLIRLKKFRNDIAHISLTTGFQQSSFLAKYAEIEQVLLRLNSNSPTPLADLKQTIDSYKNSPMDPAAEKSISEEWDKMEKDLKTKMLQMKADICNTKDAITSVKKDVSDTKDDVTSIKKDVGDTKDDITSIKTDVSYTKDDVTSIKKDVSDSKDNVTNIMKNVKDTKDAVTNIKKDIGDMQDGVTGIKTGVSDTKDDVMNIKKNVKDTQGVVTSIMKDVNDTKDDVMSIMKNVSYTKDDVTSIKKDVSDSKDDVKNIMKNVKDTKHVVTSIKKDVSYTKDDVTSIKKDVSDSKDDVKNIMKNVKDTKHVVTSIKKDVGDTKDGVTSIKTDVSDTKDDVTNIKKNVKDTKDVVTSIMKDVNDTKVDVTSIKKDVSDTKDDVVSIKKDISDTKDDVASIKKDVNDTKDDVTGIKKDISDTKDNVTSIKKDVSDLKQELSGPGGRGISGILRFFTSKFFGSGKKDLQDDLISFYKRQHRSIPLSPLVEEDQPLLKFYEMPDIQSVKVTRSRDGDRPVKTPVKTLRDVFYKESKLCSNIYLTADAGYGKTAFSKKLALAWCHAKKPNKSEKKHYSKNEISAMGGFSFVFVVLLRDSSSGCDIDMLILNQILSQLPHNYTLENLRTILCEETCLVILDGLDEWTHPLNSCSQRESNIPHQRVRENVAVLTTTRPWKLGVIGLHSSQIDQKLELEGLSNDSAKKLKRSVISHLHGEQEKRKIDKYEKEFNMTVQDSHKSDLTAIPIFLMYLLVLWYYKVNVGKSLADLFSSFIELLLSRTVKKETQTETVQENMPPCFNDKTLCKQFYTLLTTLGKLAFYTLFSETKENTLVFDGRIAEKYLSKDELTFCLKTGIITQSKVQGASLLQQTTKVSFAHKTMQEFLAALYINSALDQTSVQEIVLSKCKCVKDILDMSKIFIFIVSISGNFSFSRELMKIINEDEITQEYRSSLQSGYDHPLKELQDMYVLCFNEIPRENEANVCLQDVIIHEACKQEEYRESLKQLTTRNKNNIRSVYVDMFYMDDYRPYNTGRKVIDYISLSDLGNIEKIHYTGGYSDDDILPLNSSVKSLYLSCYMQQGSWSRSLFHKVTSLQKLEAIDISWFEMSHSELSSFLDFISQRDCLREIVLVSLTCADHGLSCTGLSIYLTGHLSLRKLTLRWLKLSKVVINMTSLENCKLEYLCNQDLVLKLLNRAHNKLNTFYCVSLESAGAIDEMFRMLRESRHIRNVILWDINFGRRSLTLSSDCVNIQYLMLGSVAMEAAALEELVGYVLKLKQTVTVDIHECTILPREEFETLKRKIKTSQCVRILKDKERGFEIETIKDGN